MSAAQTGWVATSATEDATEVNDRLGTQVAKWAARNSPATADSRRSRASSPGNASRALTATRRPSTGRARALRQKAMASAGASATRISGAEVDTATTATPRSARSRAGGDDGARRRRRRGHAEAPSLAQPKLSLPLHWPCENLGG